MAALDAQHATATAPMPKRHRPWLRRLVVTQIVISVFILGAVFAAPTVDTKNLQWVPCVVKSAEGTTTGGMGLEVPQARYQRW